MQSARLVLLLLLLPPAIWGAACSPPGEPVPELVEGQWRGSLELTGEATGEAPLALDLEAGADRRLSGVLALGAGTGDLAPLAGLEARISEGLTGEDGLFFHAVRPLPTGRVRIEVSARLVGGRLTGDAGVLVLSSRGETDLPARLDLSPVTQVNPVADPPTSTP